MSPASAGGCSRPTRSCASPTASSARRSTAAATRRASRRSTRSTGRSARSPSAAAVSDAEAPRAVAYRSTGWYRSRVPSGGAAPLPCVVALHGYGQPPEEMFEYACRVAPSNALVLAPEGPLSWYRKPGAPRPEAGGKLSGGAGGAAAGGVGYGWIADSRRDEADRRNTDFLEAVCADARAACPMDPRKTA